MTEVDLSMVLANERAAYEFPWTLGIFRDCLRVGYHCRVLEASRGVIGHGIMSVAAQECHLLNICVRPDFQRRGYGRDLVTHLLELARAKRAITALLEVRVSNAAAYRLYAGMGFDEVGVRHNYYPARHGREDAIILALDL
jgi:ribosomal-protein-alanine N-acetyltransferase